MDTMSQHATEAPGVERLIRAALTHRLSMSVKRRCRDWSWWFKGKGVRNPALPASIYSINFVCLGNICRSPFAARRAEQLLHQAGLDHIRCTSTGLRPSQAARPPQEAFDAAATYGVALDTHVPQPLTAGVLGTHDMTIVMEVSQLLAIRQAYPEFRERIFLLGLYDAAAAGSYDRLNIDDPFGHPAAVFDECYQRIDRGLQSLTRAIRRSS